MILPTFTICVHIYLKYLPLSGIRLRSWVNGTGKLIAQKVWIQTAFSYNIKRINNVSEGASLIVSPIQYITGPFTS